MWPSGLEMEQDHLILWVTNTGLTECDGVVQGGIGIVKLVLSSSSPEMASSAVADSLDGRGPVAQGLASDVHCQLREPLQCVGGRLTS